MSQKRLLANELHDLKVEEISLVPKGANRKRFLLLKSALGGDFMHDESVIDRILNTDLENEGEIEQVLKAQGLSDKATNAVKGALRLLNAYRDELPPDIINTLAALVGYGYQPPPVSESKTAKPRGEQYGDEYGEYGYGEYGDYGKGKKGKPKPKRSEDAVAQSEPVRKCLLGLARDRDEVWAGMEAAARQMFGGTDPQAISMLLATELGSRLYAEYLRAPAMPPPTPVTKAAGGGHLDDDSDAWREIVSLADSLVQKSNQPMTREQAIAAILDSARGKLLYRKYLSEKQQLIASRRR